MFKKLLDLQAELKCKKGQYNSFGGYHYRSCEDIFEAVKPLLAKYKLLLTVSDTIVQIGDRYYVKATATIEDAESDKSKTVEGYAREPLDKTKMDAAQITGTASSYARKYALNGLFLIDDTKDADTDEYAEQTKAQPKKEKTAPQAVLAPEKVAEIDDLIKATNTDRSKLLAYYKVMRIEDMSDKTAENCIAQLRKKQHG